ncbi:MAG: DUF3467 domain-containing protein [Planctomycetaceae bacterium]|nr:DUF3467 domain-containing protein [Planctomycetaceae bacterium]
MSTADDTPQPEASEAPGAETRQAPTISIDDSEIMAGYANFCRVSSTPEEMILDLGLNPNPYGAANTKIKVNQRIIMNHYTAKRLLGALNAAVQRHESAFGVLETDVRKRVKEPAQK